MEKHGPRCVRGLGFHIVGGSVDLLDLVVVQDLNPDPPVARIPRLSASIQWRELVRGHVVANFLIDRPVVHINRRQLKTEAEDPVPIHTRGWQEALEAIYPFKINVFRVAEGDLMYVEESGRPLHLRQIMLRAENIRNIRLPDHTYPSSLWLEAIVFDSGRLMLDGRADFLAEPHPGLRANLALERVALDYLKPIAARYNLVVNDGTMSANGEVEYAPWFESSTASAAPDRVRPASDWREDDIVSEPHPPHRGRASYPLANSGGPTSRHRACCFQNLDEQVSEVWPPRKEKLRCHGTRAPEVVTDSAPRPSWNGRAAGRTRA